MAKAASSARAKATTARSTVARREGQKQVPKGQRQIAALQRNAGNRAVTEMLQPAGGQPLDAATRTYMESRFQQDFLHVRVHQGERAAQGAAAEHAKAYTLGREIFFGEGRFAPETPEGRRLLAHELAHVVQQTQRDSPGATATSAEIEARDAGLMVASGHGVQVLSSAPVAIQRDPDDAVKPPVPAAPAAKGLRVDPRGTTDPVKAAKNAADLVSKFGGRLDPGKGGLIEVFNRSANKANAQLRRAAAAELDVITRYLTEGSPSGKVVEKLTVIESRKGVVSPDFQVKYTDGTSEPVEATAVTSAPGGRVTQVATKFAGDKVSTGNLVGKTQNGLATITSIKAAILRKGVGDNLQLGTGAQGLPTGGTIEVEIPFGTDPKLIDKAVADVSKRISKHVQAINFRWTSEQEQHAKRASRYFVRQGDKFVKQVAAIAAKPQAPVWAASAEVPAGAAKAEAPAGGESAEVPAGGAKADAPGAALADAPANATHGDAPSGAAKSEASAMRESLPGKPRDLNKALKYPLKGPAQEVPRPLAQSSARPAVRPSPGPVPKPPPLPQGPGREDYLDDDRGATKPKPARGLFPKTGPNRPFESRRENRAAFGTDRAAEAPKPAPGPEPEPIESSPAKAIEERIPSKPVSSRTPAPRGVNRAAIAGSIVEGAAAGMAAQLAIGMLPEEYQKYGDLQALACDDEIKEGKKTVAAVYAQISAELSQRIASLGPKVAEFSRAEPTKTIYANVTVLELREGAMTLMGMSLCPGAGEGQLVGVSLIDVALGPDKIDKVSEDKAYPATSRSRTLRTYSFRVGGVDKDAQRRQAIANLLREAEPQSIAERLRGAFESPPDRAARKELDRRASQNRVFVSPRGASVRAAPASPQADRRSVVQSLSTRWSEVKAEAKQVAGHITFTSYPEEYQALSRAYLDWAESVAAAMGRFSEEEQGSEEYQKLVTMTRWTMADLPRP